MSATLAHRGPDDRGEYVHGQIGLAMRRLSIIDLQSGHQPIANEDESAWIVCNGEIYNYRSLKRDLVQRGHRFRSSTDTEVILHRYEEVGEKVVEDLRGMFSFAIWDGKRRRLLLARDRFGQKPMYYTSMPGRFLFGSEVKAVLEGLESRPGLDIHALDDYLSLRFVPSPGTMFQGISKLPAGHILEVEFDGAESPAAVEPKISRYYQLSYVPKRKVGERQAVEEIRELLRDAVDSHLVSDVEVGAYLSGGMDSSVVVALMSQIMGASFPTFAIGVGEQDFNELPFARQVADLYDTDHHAEVVDADLVSLLPRMVYHLDEPSDPIAACMYHNAELASRHVKVVLGGDGGDEVFAGFDRYYGYKWVGMYAALPSALRRLLLGPMLGMLPDSGGYKNWTQRLRWLHGLSFHEGGRRYAEATVFFRFGEKGKGALYPPEIVEQLQGIDATRSIVDAFDEAAADEDLDRMLSCDISTRLTEHSLMLTDRMTMAHGLEGRSPFLDHPLVEYVATLPAELKLKRGRLKSLLRNAGDDWLPDSILGRPKMGFMFPLAYWMKGPLVPLIRQLLPGGSLVEQKIFRGDFVARLLQEHLEGRADHHIRLWLLLNLEVWHRMYVEGETVDQLEQELVDIVQSGHRPLPGLSGGAS